MMNNVEVIIIQNGRRYVIEAPKYGKIELVFQGGQVVTHTLKETQAYTN